MSARRAGEVALAGKYIEVAVIRHARKPFDMDKEGPGALNLRQAVRMHWSPAAEVPF